MKLKYYQANLSKYSWFTYEDVYSDFFLYYKQGFFLITIFIMAAILLYKGYTDKRNIDFPRILVPLAVYGGLALLSSIFSKYRSYSFSGIHEHFESIFVLLGYCLIVYYCLQVVKTEEDVRLIINCFLVSVIVMSILGLTQYLGRDFFTTDIGLKMILPKAQWPIRDSVQFKFEKNRVYLTFYNPNYVGSYAAMAGSFFLVLASLVRERKRMIPLYILASLGIFISLLGSKSKTGIIALAISGVFVLIVISKYIIKYFYFSIPIVLLLISIVVLYNKANDNILSNQIKQATTFHKTEVSLKDIITDDDKVIVNYQENQLHVQYSVEDGYGYFSAEDDNGKTLDLEFSEDTNEFIVQDERFPGFKLGIDLYNDTPIFYITIDNHDWFFTNQTDGTYYYLNPYGKLDKIKTAPHAVFSGYEKYASGRGYIWSRTIPLLKKNILLGSGADSYMLEFPQQDYVALHNFGFGNQLLTKPHNLYLQISVQTGLLSLIAFLAFYGMYFISSLKLYLKGKYKSYYAKVGVATLVASLNYMILGLANDSSITVTPVFWVLLGLGITVNRLAKPHIDEELSEDK
ncbi:MAG: O-antigen ligase family protein [Clostridiales bacterium]|nr:O-antigen ligase family protein [Clostridiales bacterium]